MEERLQKILSQAGYGSRRACEEFITQGRVRVNGVVAQLGQKADLGRDTLTLDGERVAAPDKRVYILLNKPRGVVSSLEAQGERKTVVDLLPERIRRDARLYPVGRLDLDSEGVILLTNDGDLTNTLTHPRYGVEKEYRVLVKGQPDGERLEAWRRGVVLENRETGERFRTRPAKVRREESGAHETTWLRVIMKEGKKHEIRDIGATLGLPVERLIRVRLGSLELGELRPREWRELTANEVRALKNVGKEGKEGSRGNAGKRPSVRTVARVKSPRARRVQR